MAGHTMTGEEWERFKQREAERTKAAQSRTLEDETRDLTDLIHALVERGHTVSVLSPDGGGFRVEDSSKPLASGL